MNPLKNMKNSQNLKGDANSLMENHIQATKTKAKIQKYFIILANVKPSKEESPPVALSNEQSVVSKHLWI